MNNTLLHLANMMLKTTYLDPHGGSGIKTQTSQMQTGQERVQRTHCHVHV